MKKVFVVACVVLGLLGCKVSDQELFSLSKGEVISLKPGAYACTGEQRHRPDSGAPTDAFGRIMRHVTIFNDVIEVAEVRFGSNMRYLISSKDDPTTGSVYAFHTLGNNLFAYALPSIEGNGQVIQFIRLIDNASAFEHLEPSGHPEEVAVAKAHNVTQTRDAGMARLGTFMMSGSASDQVAFLKALARDGKFFKTLSTCALVNG